MRSKPTGKRLAMAPTLLAPLMLWPLLLGGCGGASHAASAAGASSTTSAANANSAPATGCPQGQGLCVTRSVSFKPVGSPVIDVNLEEAIVRDHPTIKQAKVTCPSLTGYPLRCRFTGSAQADAGQAAAVAGTVTVLGVETSTRTYAYALTYSPTHG